MHDERNENAHDSEPHVFLSGAKSSGRLPRFDLIPWDVFAERLARRYELGLQKYSEDNYRKGINDRAFVLDRCNHMLAHAHKAVESFRTMGTALERESDDDDLAAVIWGAIFLMLVQEQGGGWYVPDEQEQAQ